MTGHGLSRDRVVAVVVALDDGTEQVGSGYLVGAGLVLTAEHVTRNKDTTSGAQVTRVQVVHLATGTAADVAGDPLSDDDLDVAVLTLNSPHAWPARSTPVEVWGVDRSGPGVLGDCVVIGLPSFAYDPNKELRGTAELHGDVYQTDGAETGHLLMREPRLHGTHDPDTGRSGWNGLSGALVFYKGQALGVVVEHHPSEGDNSVRMIGFDKITSNKQIRAALRLPEPRDLPRAVDASGASVKRSMATERLTQLKEWRTEGLLTLDAVSDLQKRVVSLEFFGESQ